MSKVFSSVDELTLIVTEAADLGKKTLVYVHSNQLVQCLSIANLVDDWTTEYAETFVFATVNINDEASTDVIKHLGIKAAPSFALVNKDGDSQVGDLEAALHDFLGANKPSKPVVDPLRHITSIAGLDQVLDEAKQEDKIVLIDFSADWCPPCIAIAPAFKALARSSDHPRVIFVSVDVDEADELDEKFQIQSMPTFIALQPSVSESDLVFYLEGAEIAHVHDFLQQVKDNKILEVAERPEVSDDEWSDDEDEDDDEDGDEDEDEDDDEDGDEDGDETA